MRFFLLFASLGLASGVALRSSALESQCSASFPGRLQDAKQAIVQWGDEHERYVEARPLLEFFEGHCRFLSDRERAARKLDDANAFVCDAPKPKGLTAELVLRYSVEPSLGVYQARAGDDARCLDLDRAERIGLVISSNDDREGAGQRLLVLCYGDERPRCANARATIEATLSKAKP